MITPGAAYWSTVQQARAIRERKFKSRELLELLIDRVQQINGDLNAVVMAEAHQRRLLQIRVQLHLVHGRPVAGGFQQRGELVHAEVGHADLAGQIIVHQRFHGAPGVGHRHVLGVQDIGAGFRKTDARGQRHRPDDRGSRSL